MIKEKRLKLIEDYIQEQDSVSLEELMSVFNVSKNTIRRDVQGLVESGSFKKVYGGVAVKQKNLEPFQDRSVRNFTEKALICKRSANFVDDGDIIFIDSGTTTVEMFQYLKKKNLTVITNNIEFIVRSLPFENMNIISIGGMLERQTNSLVNSHKMAILSTYNINKAFMATTGISLTNGVTNASPIETNIKQEIVRKSKKVFVLADHDKFNRHGLMTYCELEDIDYLITDQKPPKEFDVFALELDFELVIAGE